MPSKPKHPCGYPGCPELVEDGKYYCTKHEKQVKAKIDKRRGTSVQRGYDARWRKVRRQYLAEHPLCVECLKEGRITPAAVVDHIIPHRGNQRLFWDVNNWQSLCTYHHNVKTAKEIHHRHRDNMSKMQGI